MPESKNTPQVKRLQGGILIPYNVQQITRTNEDDEQVTFYEFDRIKLNQHELPGLNDVREYIVQQLREDLHVHVFTHYDLGSQNSINGMAQRANRLDRTDIMDECEAILDWVGNCLGYYYTKKEALLGASDEVSLIEVAWNFEVNVPKPDALKSLKEIRGMF